VPGRPAPADLFHINEARPPPDVSTLSSSAGLAGANALSNSLAFLLRDPGEYSSEKIPYWTAGIEPRLLVAHHANLGRPELSHVSSHGPDALSTQTIERPEQ
jgi:hypothetical protein